MSFKVKNLKTSDGMIVDVYDDVFTYQEREYFEFFMSMSEYTYRQSTGSHITNHLPWTHLHKRLSTEEVKKFGLLENKNLISIISNYDLNTIITSWFNLSLPCTQYQIHSDNPTSNDNIRQLTLMYYATNTWKESYGGETFFYNNRLEKEIVVDFVPGRFVLFDSRIPHKPAFSFGHVVGRYIFVSLLMKVENESNYTGR